MFQRVVLWLLAVIYLVRFAVPALVSASGARVFGAPWLDPGQEATALLDSDIRYWGVMCATMAFLFVALSFDVKRHLVALDALMLGVLVGAGIRTAEIFLVGVPAGPALVATGVEWVFPLAWFVSTAGLRKLRRFQLSESVVIDAPKAAVWGLFADFGGVDQWHPYMESASLDPGSAPSGVGAARSCVFGPKMAIRETVVEWDDAGSMTIAIEFLRGLAPPINDIRASVRVELVGPERCRLVLSMAYQERFGPFGGFLSEMFIAGQYRGVFQQMLGAAKARAETGTLVPQVVMPMSGRVLSA